MDRGAQSTDAGAPAVVRRAQAFAYTIAAIAAFTTTLFLAIADRTASATLTAGLFVVVVLLWSVPQLDSFKAFTIEAQFRKRLNEADDIIARLSRLTLFLAERSFVSFAYEDRMTKRDLADKIAAADAIRELARKSGADPDRLRELGLPFVAATMFDGLNYLSEIVRRSQNGNAWAGPDRMFHRLMEARSHEVLRQVAGETIPEDIAIRDKDALISLRDRLVAAAEECFRLGTVTTEAGRAFAEIEAAYDRSRGRS